MDLGGLLIGALVPKTCRTVLDIGQHLMQAMAGLADTQSRIGGQSRVRLGAGLDFEPELIQPKLSCLVDRLDEIDGRIETRRRVQPSFAVAVSSFNWQSWSTAVKT